MLVLAYVSRMDEIVGAGRTRAEARRAAQATLTTLRSARRQKSLERVIYFKLLIVSNANKAMCAERALLDLINSGAFMEAIPMGDSDGHEIEEHADGDRPRDGHGADTPGDPAGEDLGDIQRAAQERSGDADVAAIIDEISGADPADPGPSGGQG